MEKLYYKIGKIEKIGSMKHFWTSKVSPVVFEKEKYLLEQKFINEFRNHFENQTEIKIGFYFNKSLKFKFIKYVEKKGE